MIPIPKKALVEVTWAVARRERVTSDALPWSTTTYRDKPARVNSVGLVLMVTSASLVLIQNFGTDDVGSDIITIPRQCVQSVTRLKRLK